MIGADGKPVLNAAGEPIVIDPRLPAGGSIGEGGVLLGSNGLPIMGEDGRPMVLGMAGALKPLSKIKFTDIEKEMDEGAAKARWQKAKRAFEKKQIEHNHFSALPRIPVHHIERQLLASRECLSPPRSKLWDHLAQPARDVIDARTRAEGARTHGSHQGPHRRGKHPPSRWRWRKGRCAWQTPCRRTPSRAARAPRSSARRSSAPAAAG